MASHKSSRSKRKSAVLKRNTLEPFTQVADSQTEVLPVSSSKKDVFPVVFRLLFFLFMLWFWGFRYRDFLYMSQEYDLFIWNWEYLAGYGSRIVGLSRWLSSFILQFFYYPIFGGVIMAAFSSFIQYGSEKLFRLNRWGLFLTLLPSCILAIQITNINFFIFESFDVAYLFSFTFNYAYVIGFVILFESIKRPTLRTIFLVAGILLTYPVFGFFTLLASLLCTLKELSRVLFSKEIPGQSEKSVVKNKRRFFQKQKLSKIERIELLILFTLIVPVVYWPLYAETTPSLRHMYVAGLREESVLTQGREISTNLIFTLCITLVLSFFLLAAVLDLLRSRKALKSSPTLPLESHRAYALRIGTTFVMLLALCSGAVFLSFSSPNFLMLLKIAQALDKEDWEAILHAEAQIVTPSNPAVTARHLALSRLNRLADEAFIRPVFPKESPQLKIVTTNSMCGDRMLYELGLTNGAERAAFNNYVAKGGRTYWALKTLALCAIADGRHSLAERYLYRIRKTLFHKTFANEALDYLARYGNNSRTFDEYVKASNTTSEKRISEFAKSVELVRELAPLTDVLLAPDNMNAVYYSLLQNEDVSKRSLKEQENRLTYLLIMRHLPKFGKFFDEYAKMKGDERTPRYLQEAALLREQLPSIFDENGATSWTIPDSIKIVPELRERFDRYLDAVNRSDFRSPAGVAKVREEFGDSFWFFISEPKNIENY